MSELLFKDRVRERDLDNVLVEELHASLEHCQFHAFGITSLKAY